MSSTCCARHYSEALETRLKEERSAAETAAAKRAALEWSLAAARVEAVQMKKDWQEVGAGEGGRAVRPRPRPVLWEEEAERPALPGNTNTSRIYIHTSIAVSNSHHTSSGSCHRVE